MNKKTISVSSYPRKDLSYLWKARGLASALGISNAYLSQLEKGIRTHPSAELLDKIVKILCLNKYKDGLINRRTAEAEMFFGE